MYRKRRKFLLGRQAAKTKLSEENRVHKIRVRGGNFKLRALRLNSGIFSWGSEGELLHHCTFSYWKIAHYYCFNIFIDQTNMILLILLLFLVIFIVI